MKPYRAPIAPRSPVMVELDRLMGRVAVKPEKAKSAPAKKVARKKSKPAKKSNPRRKANT